MERERNFWVVGGDLRQVKLAQLLQNDGHTVHTAALERGMTGSARSVPAEEAARAHCVVLPLPVMDQRGLLHAPLSGEERRLEEFLDLLHPGQILCGGMLSPPVEEMAHERGLRLFDYYAREECKIANAVPTAEGAVQIAMENLDATLRDSRCLVIGFGRVGKLTAHRLKSLGARVTVAARACEDWAWAQAYGYDAEDSRRLACWLGGYDLIVNTVPAPILDAAHLEWVQPDVFIIDLASHPGGAGFSEGPGIKSDDAGQTLGEVSTMPDEKDLEIPLGFGMALAQNTLALERFSALPKERRNAIIEGSRNVRSKAEMADYVNRVP